MMKLVQNSIFYLLFLFTYSVSAITVTGFVVDEKNQPLSFVSVFISGTSIGTTANVEGEYRLELKSGSYELTYKMIGYTAKVEKVNVQNKTVTLNMQLNQETVNLKAVVIRADAEDPAYEVIRNAKKKRKFYQP